MKNAVPFSLVLMLTLIHVGVAAEPNQQNQQRRGRITFEQFSTRHDTNKDGKVERDEFKGAAQWFRWLDQNGDGTVTAEEFQKRTQRDGRQQPGGGRRVPEGVKVHRDLEYANVDGESLKLDLYLPEKSDSQAAASCLDSWRWLDQGEQVSIQSDLRSPDGRRLRRRQHRLPARRPDLAPEADP